MTTDISLNSSEKKQLLRLARDSIRFCFDPNEQKKKKSTNRLSLEKCKQNLFYKYSTLDIPVLAETLTCFVTLYTLNADNNRLRGCIGTVNVRKDETLLQNLISNSIMAAFFDSRFEPLQESELYSTRIEISILSKPHQIVFKTEAELYALIKGKGVVLQSGIHQATFLPQVWQQLPRPQDFIHHLTQKAGITSGGYLDYSYEIYEVFAFEELD